MHLSGTYRSIFSAVVGALALMATSGAATADPTPDVTFTFDAPAEMEPNTPYTLALKYAVTGTDLRNVQIDIDLPPNVVVFGHGAVTSFQSYCSFEGNDYFDWTCSFHADLLPVPSGGLSGQIPITVRLPPGRIPDGTTFGLSATMNAQYGPESAPIDIPAMTANATTALADTVLDLRLGHDWHNSSETGFATVGGVLGVVTILYNQVYNQAAGYVHPGSTLSTSLPQVGLRYVKEYQNYGLAISNVGSAWDAVSALEHDVSITIPDPYVNLQYNGSQGYVATQIYSNSAYGADYLWVPCSSAQLPSETTLTMSLAGSTASDGSNPSTLREETFPPNYLLTQTPTLCDAAGYLTDNGYTTLGPGQTAYVGFTLEPPGGSSPARDAFLSVAIPSAIRHDYLSAYIGWARGYEDHGFRYYACQIPAVQGELGLADFLANRDANCTEVARDTQYDFTATTHLVAYADTWSIDEHGVAVTYGPFQLYIYVGVEGCAGIGDTFTWQAHSSVRRSAGATPEVHSAVHQITITGDSQVYITNYSNKTTANRGTLETYTLGFQPYSGYAPPKNPVYTIDLPPGVIPIEAQVGYSYGDCDAAIVQSTFTLKPDGSYQIRLAGDGTEDIYAANNCSEVGCAPAFYPYFRVTVFYDPSYPFTQGQLVQFVQKVVGDNVIYPPTTNFNVTMQVPAEMRLTVEPVCDDEGTMGLKGTIVNSGGVPLTNLALVMPLPKAGDGSGTEIDTFFKYASFAADNGVTASCFQGGSWIALTGCDATATKVRLEVPSLAPYAAVPLTMYLDVASTAQTGDIVRGTADLSSAELLPITTRESAPAKVNLCPGELEISGWFDQSGDGVRDADETALAGWKVILLDLLDTDIQFEIPFTNEGFVVTNLAAGSYGLVVVNPNAPTEAVWSYTTNVPQTFTITTGETTTILVGAACTCQDQDVCTRDTCSVAGTCSYVAEAHPEVADDNCDGVDDNCDGVADEGYESVPTTCGSGACASTGATSCVGGQVYDSCVAQEGGEEVCDGRDNDCDGNVDGEDVDCDDGNPCTTDTCGGKLGCQHVANTAPCEDGSACT
ncbi:MAG: hypothetical protein KC635_01035, partial [Myxococcales bacterium]|nr:hypothetical protein [Myxococcales bacterium]